jgi:hypothetical protein
MYILRYFIFLSVPAGKFRADSLKKAMATSKFNLFFLLRHCTIYAGGTPWSKPKINVRQRELLEAETKPVNVMGI